MTREQAMQSLITQLGYGARGAESVIDKIYDAHNLEIKAKDEEIERLKEFEEMVEWMELNSNRSLCDYYNNKDNK